VYSTRTPLLKYFNTWVHPDPCSSSCHLHRCSLSDCTHSSTYMPWWWNRPASSSSSSRPCA